eukprot:1815886-Rhodomonas_salina.1
MATLLSCMEAMTIFTLPVVHGRCPAIYVLIFVQVAALVRGNAEYDCDIAGICGAGGALFLAFVAAIYGKKN